MKQQLRDRSIVIMGGTAGIGLSAAEMFLREGARIVCVGRDRGNAAVARKLLGKRALVLVGDAQTPTTAERAVREAVKVHGSLHGLYHVAGGSGRAFGDGVLAEVSDEGWEATLSLNLSSVFYSNRAAVRQLLRQGKGGSILNLGSVLGCMPAAKHFATTAYATAKAAIVGLTRSSAAAYTGSNIRFNVLAPALVATPMSKRAQENPNIMRFISTKQPLDGGRIGQCADLDAAAVYFMADSSRFVTGQVLSVDGGWGVSDGQFDFGAA